MEDFSECRACGTLFHLGEGAKGEFRCSKCKAKVRKLTTSKVKVEKAGEKNVEGSERYHVMQDRLTRGIFLLGSTVGIFVVFMMIPTALYFENSAVVFFLMLVELVFGTLLVCSSVSLYLLSIQVRGMQSLMTFQQHNLSIFHDQISRLFAMFKRRS
jgi:LSD1 subclass zinc finger protein